MTLHIKTSETKKKKKSFIKGQFRTNAEWVSEEEERRESQSDLHIPL